MFYIINHNGVRMNHSRKRGWTYPNENKCCCLEFLTLMEAHRYLKENGGFGVYKVLNLKEEDICLCDLDSEEMEDKVEELIQEKQDIYNDYREFTEAILRIVQIDIIEQINDIYIDMAIYNLKEVIINKIKDICK